MRTTVIRASDECVHRNDSGPLLAELHAHIIPDPNLALASHNDVGFRIAWRGTELTW